MIDLPPFLGRVIATWTSAVSGTKIALFILLDGASCSTELPREPVHHC